jgi:hypothetical protein
MKYLKHALMPFAAVDPSISLTSRFDPELIVTLLPQFDLE